MKSEDYSKILDGNLKRSVKNLDLRRQFIFQQDNDANDMSKSMTAWLQKTILMF